METGDRRDRRRLTFVLKLVSPRSAHMAPSKAHMPDFIQPQHPLLVARAPRSDQWLHEIKFDGYRVQLRVKKKQPAVIRVKLRYLLPEFRHSRSKKREPPIKPVARY